MKTGSTPKSTSLVKAQSSTRTRQPLPGWDWCIGLVAIALALIVFTAFIPALDNGFVNWDDDENFLDNPYYRGLGVAQMKWAWSTFRLGVYQPLAWILFEAQYVFWKLDPRGYHLTSMILHAANAVVLYLLTVTVLVRCQTDLWRRNPWTCAWGLASRLRCSRCTRYESRQWLGHPASRTCRAPSFPCSPF